jgi:two-component system sensor histidine kinase HydH
VPGLVARLLRRQQAVAAELAQRRRLAALGEMSATLAHELRNPLASAKGHAQLLLEALEPDTRPHRKAQRVVHEVLRLEALVNDLLEFVRSGRIHAAPVCPADVVRASAAAVDGARISVDTAAAPASWPLDAARMEQVLVNLFRNCLQSAPEGSPVTAEVRLEAGQLVIRVRDRGPGIDPAVRDTLFEPFVTTRVRGLGLGLAVCRRIVEAHGGAIDASDHPEGGALFRIRIPG